MIYYKILSIACGGFIGSVLRYKVSLYFSEKTSGTFPYGTLFINILGSFFLGCVISLNSLFGLNQYLYLVMTAGFAGAFTTFSTAMFELYKLIENEEWMDGVKYFLYTIFGGVFSSILGYGILQMVLN